MVTDMKMIGALVTEEQHRRLKQWCGSNCTTITRVLQDSVVGLLDSIDHLSPVNRLPTNAQKIVEAVVLENQSMPTDNPNTQITQENFKVKTIEIRGISYKAPTPCQITKDAIIIPEDTSDDDIALLSGLGLVVEAKEGWKTVTPLTKV
jgi:hypothetical protein